MTMQDVYDFAYTESYIPAMKNLMKQIGKEKFLEMLKISSDMVYQVDNKNEIDYSTRTMEAWSESMKTAIKDRMTKRLSYEIITDNPELLEIKFTESLWAKTFRDADAADIGYAGFCYRDYSMARAFNPKLKLTRDKTLMQGHDCCNFNWTMET